MWDLVWFFLLILLVASCIWAMWGVVANTRSMRDRRAILDWMRERGDWRELYVAFERVDYEDHQRAIMYFKDPWVLYPPEFRKARPPR